MRRMDDDTVLQNLLTLLAYTTEENSYMVAWSLTLAVSLTPSCSGLPRTDGIEAEFASAIRTTVEGSGTPCSAGCRFGTWVSGPPIPGPSTPSTPVSRHRKISKTF